MSNLSKAIIAMLALASMAQADEAGRGKTTSRTEKLHGEHGRTSFVLQKDMQWVDAPPTLPKGPKMAVLLGDPTKKGRFVIRFKVPSGYRVPPHHHSSDEEFTMVSGRFVFNMGDQKSPDVHELSAGDFHFLPAKTIHWVEAKEETVFQLSAMGPFDIVYLNAADNPARQTARR